MHKTGIVLRLYGHGVGARGRGAADAYGERCVEIPCRQRAGNWRIHRATASVQRRANPTRQLHRAAVSVKRLNRHVNSLRVEGIVVVVVGLRYLHGGR